MKSFSIGLFTIIALAVVGFLTFRATTGFMSRFASPSPSPSPSETTTSSPAPTASPAPTKRPATTRTVTTTTSHLTLTLAKTSACPITYMTEVRDITGPLTLRYTLKEGYSFAANVWNKSGNELVNNTVYTSTSGTITRISDVDYMRVRIESKDCTQTSDTWLTVTAER